MKAVIQKSGPAKVEVDGKVTGRIDKGLVILLGVKPADSSHDVDYLVEKIANLRLFQKGDKDFEESLQENNKEALVISQFTLYASCKKGRRPDFGEAAKADIAEPLYQEFVKKLGKKGIKVETGIFGAEMLVSLVNEGPVTIILESPTV